MSVPSPLTDQKLWRIATQVLESWKTRNSLVAAQLDSYNYFLHVTLHQIIAEYGSFECTAEGSGIKHIIRISNVHLRLPEIMESTGNIYPLSPFTCLLRKLDYMASVLVDISHQVVSATGERHENRFREHNLFDLPVMVQSAACRTLEFMAQESMFDTGGHFIIAGSEKILLAQEKLRVNYPFVSRVKKASKLLWTCEVRSWTESKMRSTSTSYFYLHEKKGASIGTPQHELKIKMPFLDKYEIPMILVFRVLGIANPQAFIPHDAAIDGLLRSILTDHAELGYSTMPMEDIYELIAKKGIKDLSKLKTAEKRQKYVEHIILNEFLPHETDKPTGLGLIVWEMLMTVKGVFKPGDRDAFSKKRLHCAGVLMALQLRILLRPYLKGVQLTLQKSIDAGRYIDIIDIMSAKKVTSGLKFALATGRWGAAKGANKGGQDGTAQVYTRSNLQASLSHARRTNTPLNRESKQAKPRQVRPSHFGLLCAVETPEGPSCGLIESLTTLAHIRIGGGGTIVEWLTRKLAGPLLTSQGLYFVLLNGTIMGRMKDEAAIIRLMQALRGHRRAQDMPFDTTIAWDVSKRQLLLTTDVGAVLRPMFVVENLHRLRELVTDDPAFFDILLTEGVIEYLDKEEEELNATVAIDIRHISAETTHLEINPGVMLGLSAGNIPFLDHNQAPRNIYGSIQGKQAAGIPQTNFFHRFDTNSHVLNYVERPIVSTMSSNLFGNDECPAGQNVVLAIMAHSYNQEDSNIINQGFIDRGGMSSTIFHTYSAEERLSTNDKEVFGKPQIAPTSGSAEGTVLHAQRGNYDLLNDQGFAPPGSCLKAHQGTAIIGKIMSSLQNENGEMERDRSLIVHPNESVYVDRVLKTLGSEGNVIVKVRTRSYRRPELGDKFAATCGQKNTCGMIRAEVDMPFGMQTGIVPDLIINPHCIPSRMTIGLLLEALLGKTACLEGKIGDGTPFKEITADSIGEVLHKHGFQSRGHETLIDGETGEILQGSQIFVGVCFYQRLRHMTIDKIHARHNGPVQLLSRLPSEGRSRGGGLKFGEMEVSRFSWKLWKEQERVISVYRSIVPKRMVSAPLPLTECEPMPIPFRFTSAANAAISFHRLFQRRKSKFWVVYFKQKLHVQYAIPPSLSSRQIRDIQPSYFIKNYKHWDLA